MTRTQRIIARVALAIGLIVVGFPLLQSRVRRLEVDFFTVLLRLFGVGGRVISAEDALVLIPSGDMPFRVVVTPTCSSLAAVLALGSLGMLTRHRNLARRAGAISVALAAVFIGNTIRIVASLLVGLSAGSSSLVLFHDYIGGAFTFVYVLGGYVAMIALLLPAVPSVRRLSTEVAGAS